MADEPRRSGRPTKGLHPKMDQVDAPPSGKKKGKRGKKQAVEEEEGEAETIRCVCGATSDDDPGEAWIACDNCGVWQHNVCVGVSSFEEDVPKNYMCELCDPNFHKELLDAVHRGEYPWEDRKAEHKRLAALAELEEQEETGVKKKKGRGRAKRISDGAELHQVANGKAKSPSTPVPDLKKKDTPAKGGSSKRKVRDEFQDTASAKVQRTSAGHVTPKQKSPPSDLPSTIAEIDTAHQGPAKLILKALTHAIPIAVKEGIYTYSMGDTLKTKAERLAIEVHDAIFKAYPDVTSSGYKSQFRAIAANLKTNQELCNGLLNRTLSPAQLARMSTDDMASKELKQETAKMKAKADKAAIMITEDDGPRIRRTHKGDEIIEGDSFMDMSEPQVSRQRRRSMLDPNADMATRSRENSPGNEVELPDNIDYRSTDDIRGHAQSKVSLNVQTKPPPVRKASTQNFDYNNIISKVSATSPTGTTHPSHIRRASTNLPPPSGPGDDPDIDRLLQDDGNESPPYSPAEYDSDPDIVWRGKVTMDSIAEFSAVAKHVGGADLKQHGLNHLQWNDILQKDLRVAGRIDQDKANEYLCSLRYSPPTDVVVVSVTPTGEIAAKGFKGMFDYFHTKNRYGVLTNKGVGNIRDTYLVPVPASPGRLPDFLVNLEDHKVPDDRPNPMILVALVIRTQWEEHQRSFDGSEGQSPSIQTHPVRQLSMSGIGPSMSPIAPQNSSFINNGLLQSPHPPAHLTAEEIQRRQDRERAQSEGEAVARQILGDYVRAPTIGFLMPQAFQMRPLEWEVIRKILEEDPRASQDLQHLSSILEIRMSQQPPQQPPPQPYQQTPGGPPPPPGVPAGPPPA